MSGDDSRWSGGRQAWERLAGWVRDRADGDPLTALSDVGQLRRLLEEAELAAVREARAARKSWSEIAVRLGVTRQSAWERWRDLDDGPAVAEGADLLSRAARRRSWITVPDVVGSTFGEARAALASAGLVGVSPDSDDPAGLLLAAAQAVVVEQSPQAGERVQPGTPVRLRTRRGGGGGVREPRRPGPIPLAGREALDEGALG